MKTQNSFRLESKPRNFKQWLDKHDTLVLIVLASTTVAILYFV